MTKAIEKRMRLQQEVRTHLSCYHLGDHSQSEHESSVKMKMKTCFLHFTSLHFTLLRFPPQSPFFDFLLGKTMPLFIVLPILETYELYKRDCIPIIHLLCPINALHQLGSIISYVDISYWILDMNDTSYGTIYPILDMDIQYRYLGGESAITQLRKLRQHRLIAHHIPQPRLRLSLCSKSGSIKATCCRFLEPRELGEGEGGSSCLWKPISTCVGIASMCSRRSYNMDTLSQCLTSTEWIPLFTARSS